VQISVLFKAGLIYKKVIILHMNTKQNQKNYWIFDGKPEYLELNLSDTAAHGSGYILAIQMESGDLRVASTLYPIKYLNDYRLNARRFGINQISRVLVSKPHIRYEAIKRAILEKLPDFKKEGTALYQLPLDTLSEKAQEIFIAAGMQPTVSNSHAKCD